MICHNCLREELIPDEDTHRCLADPLSCCDGVDCPDYVENCECRDCEVN